MFILESVEGLKWSFNGLHVNRNKFYISALCVLSYLQLFIIFLGGLKNPTFGDGHFSGMGSESRAQTLQRGE